MKNLDKMRKLVTLLEKEEVLELYSDFWVISQIEGLIDDVDDKKLKLRLEKSLEEIKEEYCLRDLEEEAKVEFYCDDCHKYLPKDKESESKNQCLECCKREEQEDEDDWDE